MSVSMCWRRFPLRIQSRFLPPNRNGYIVLLPEISPDVPENSVLMKDNMPDFTNLTTEKCVTTVGKQLLDFEQGIRVVEQAIDKAGSSDVVKEIIEPIEKINVSFETAWGIVKNLYLTNTKLMPAKTYLPLHHRARRARSSKFYSKSIFNACKEFDKTNMTEEEQRIVDKFLLEGRMAGLDLSEENREILAKLYIKLDEHKASFNQRIEITSNMFHHIFHDPAIAREMPDHLLRLMAENKDEPTRGPWKVTLDPQIVEDFLKYCPDRTNRWNVWQAKVHVASQTFESTSLRNSSTLENMRVQRNQQAKLLGYKTFAHMSMESKMAGSLENVQETLGHLLKVAKPIADREVADLQKFAWDRGFQANLEIYDIPFWSRKQKRTLFNYQEETLVDYFPFDKVWTGLLDLCEKVFGIKLVENNKVDRWHPDVRFFYVYEEDSNKPVGGFYLDPFMRPDKLCGHTRGAWVVNITPAARLHKTLPLSSLVLQMDPPMFGKPALMQLSEVKSLFQQFGHILQQLLTTVNYSEVAGQANVEWDAVEIVGNVFLHWLKQPEVLESITEHYATKEKLSLPLAEIEKHFAAFNLCDELFKAHLDLELYSTDKFWLDIMKRLWQTHYTVPMYTWDGTPCNFKEIVTEEWCAAYFSHIWARMVAADVFSAFTEPDVDVRSIGDRFRDTYLAFGGSCHPGEVFRRFRGRDPSSEAYLKDLGLH